MQFSFIAALLPALAAAAPMISMHGGQMGVRATQTAHAGMPEHSKMPHEHTRAARGEERMPMHGGQMGAKATKAAHAGTPHPSMQARADPLMGPAAEIKAGPSKTIVKAGTDKAEPKPLSKGDTKKKGARALHERPAARPEHLIAARQMPHGMGGHGKPADVVGADMPHPTGPPAGSPMGGDKPAGMPAGGRGPKPAPTIAARQLPHAGRPAITRTREAGAQRTEAGRPEHGFAMGGAGRMDPGVFTWPGAPAPTGA